MLVAVIFTMAVVEVAAGSAIWPCPGPCLAQSPNLQSFDARLWNCTETCNCPYDTMLQKDGQCAPCQDKPHAVALPTLITDCSDMSQFTCEEGYFLDAQSQRCTPCFSPPSDMTCPLGMYQERCLKTAMLECFPCSQPSLLNRTTQQYGPQKLLPACASGAVAPILKISSSYADFMRGRLQV